MSRVPSSKLCRDDAGPGSAGKMSDCWRLAAVTAPLDRLFAPVHARQCDEGCRAWQHVRLPPSYGAMLTRICGEYVIEGDRRAGCFDRPLPVMLVSWDRGAAQGVAAPR
jgi:hypothetical protein